MFGSDLWVVEWHWNDVSDGHVYRDYATSAGEALAMAEDVRACVGGCDAERLTVAVGRYKLAATSVDTKVEGVR